MSKKKILLAEDDADDRYLFYDFLQDRPDIVLLPAAENGVILLEALDRIEEQDELPDLIILDQNMPKSNGLQTLQLLKGNDRYAAIPVMIYSTYTDSQLVNTCVAVGASAVLSKPDTKEGYHEMINTFLTSIAASQ